MEITDIEAGKTYACKFKVRTFVDSKGNAIDTRDLKIGESVEDGEPGDYHGFGFISQRDSDKNLLEVVDQKTNRAWVVHWNDVWDVDIVEWVDNHAS